MHPGGTARYAIWVWPAGGAAGGVTVSISGEVGGIDVTPAFAVCPAANGRTCMAGRIGGGTSDELEATIAVPDRTAAGKQAVLTAAARASDAAAPPTAGAAITITAEPSGTHPASPVPGSGAGAGLGATLPAGLPPTLPSSGDPAASLFELPGPVTPAGSPGSMFPVVSPQQSASPDSAVLPGTRGIRAADAAAAFRSAPGLSAVNSVAWPCSLRPWPSRWSGSRCAGPGAARARD